LGFRSLAILVGALLSQRAGAAKTHRKVCGSAFSKIAGWDRQHLQTAVALRSDAVWTGLYYCESGAAALGVHFGKKAGEAADVFIAIDVSRSMLANDVEPTV
jgi:hypothetical protein